MKHCKACGRALQYDMREGWEHADNQTTYCGEEPVEPVDVADYYEVTDGETVTIEQAGIYRVVFDSHDGERTIKLTRVFSK